MLHDLTPAARAFLTEPRFAILATIAPSGLPQQSVVWYLIEGDTLLFNTRKGRVKDDNIARDPRVSLCVADGYQYITIQGTAQTISDPATTQADIKRIAIYYQGAEAGAARAVSQFTNEERVSYRVPLDQVLVYGFDS
jgi:PPOX class probable F420-dependent enzyme